MDDSVLLDVCFAGYPRPFAGRSGFLMSLLGKPVGGNGQAVGDGRPDYP
jgi:hypothetical protein